MNPEDKPVTIPFPCEDRAFSCESRAGDAPDWNEHEHVSHEVQLQAQKLVDLVGSPELAKFAIGVVEKSQCDPQRQVGAMSASNARQNDRFLKALQEFETSLETPVISGELIGWVTTIKKACETVGSMLRDDVPLQHSTIYRVIAREDQELANRVEKLRANDEQLTSVDFGVVECSIEQLLDRAESVEQDELKAARLREEVIRQGLAFVISARTQETEITTWFSEAFNRDSGSGD